MVEADGLPTPLTEQAETVRDVWAVFLPIAVGVFFMVVLVVLYIVIRFRRSEDGIPHQVHYNISFEVAYTTIPLVLVIGLFALTLTSIDSITEQSAEPDLVIDVVGFQWQWQFDYPESGASVTGTETEVPTLALPAGQSVRFNLESVDVIHSFWVPGFLFKRDVVPGRTSSFDIDVIDVVGSYTNGACAEFCGVFHNRMTFNIEVMPPADFAAWLEEHEQ